MWGGLPLSLVLASKTWSPYCKHRNVFKECFEKFDSLCELLSSWFKYYQNHKIVCSSPSFWSRILNQPFTVFSLCKTCSVGVNAFYVHFCTEMFLSWDWLFWSSLETSPCIVSCSPWVYSYVFIHTDGSKTSCLYAHVFSDFLTESGIDPVRINWISLKFDLLPNKYTLSNIICAIHLATACIIHEAYACLVRFMTLSK